jgi:hypothetical protein
MVLPVSALSALVLAAGAGGASAAPSRATQAVSGFPAPQGAGISTEIVLDNGGYKQCLNYAQGLINPGTKVILYTCNPNDLASQWLTYPDDTIRPYRNVTMVLTVVNGKLVLESAQGGSGDEPENWYFSPTGEIINGQTTPGSNHLVLNDPGYRTANGTQLIVYNQPTVTSNAHWYVPKAHYATSKLTSRPDTGGDGTWATDTIARNSMVVYMGSPGALPSGAYYYQAGVADTGTFITSAGSRTPNQDGTDAGLTLGTALGGTITGGAGYHVSTSKFVSGAPAAAYSGAQPATADWAGLWFPGETSFGEDGIDSTGPDQEDWTYLTGKDACGQTETWVEAGYDSLGQSANAGNVTAPTASNCPG